MQVEVLHSSQYPVMAFLSMLTGRRILPQPAQNTLFPLGMAYSIFFRRRLSTSSGDRYWYAVSGISRSQQLAGNFTSCRHSRKNFCKHCWQKLWLHVDVNVEEAGNISQQMKHSDVGTLAILLGPASSPCSGDVPRFLIARSVRLES